jgi:hypothetical protein
MSWFGCVFPARGRWFESTCAHQVSGRGGIEWESEHRLCAFENPGHLSPRCRVLISWAFQRRIRVVQAPDDMVRLESATGEDIQARPGAAVSRRRAPGCGSSAMWQATRQHAACGCSSPARAHARRYFPSARPVIYRHHVENEARPFPYYLFSRRELISELSAAGFALVVLESDSILPERRLVRRPRLAPVDDFLCWLLPSWAGYGLRAVCRAGP